MYGVDDNEDEIMRAAPIAATFVSKQLMSSLSEYRIVHAVESPP